MIRRTIWLLALAAALMSVVSAAPPEGFLRADGTRIVDGQGQPVLLRGMGLGGWMLQEGYMLGIKKEGTQHSIKARIADLVGKEDTERFYTLWRQHHMTRADVDRLAASGFNSIRLPMHYNLFTLPIEEEPVKGKDTWLTAGFEMTDDLLAWCRANRMYLILDLHAAPGGQGKDANISDYDPAKPSLWESEENRRKTVALWRKLAERYANEPWIGGYDILNEPNWTFEGKDKNGREDIVQPAHLGSLQGDHRRHSRGGHQAPHHRRGQRLGQQLRRVSGAMGSKYGHELPQVPGTRTPRRRSRVSWPCASSTACPSGLARAARTPTSGSGIVSPWSRSTESDGHGGRTRSSPTRGAS